MVYDGSGRLTSQRDPRGNVPVTRQRLPDLTDL